MDIDSTRSTAPPEPQKPEAEGKGGPDEQKMIFEDEKYSSKCFVLMSELRNNGHFCDVTLCVKDIEIPAHRVILASASVYFKNMLLSGMKESRMSRIELKDVDPKALEQLINFAYSHKLDITSENVQSLMTVASMLSFTPAFEACAQFLASNLHPSNCLGIRDFAELMNCPQLIKKATKYFMHNFMDVILKEEYFSLSINVLEGLLKMDTINVPSEEHILTAVLSWVNHDKAERQSFLPRLIKCVRLPLLSPGYIVEYLEKNPCILSSVECRDCINFAKNYHLGVIKFEKLNLTTECQLLRPRKSASGLLFAVGGRGMSHSEQPFDNVEVYNFYANEWQEVAPLTSPRRHVGVTSLNGKVYAVGGENMGRHLKTVECYCMEEKKWKMVAHLNEGRRGIAVGVLEGVLYAAGGLDEERSYNLVERYDPEANSWSTVASMIGMRCGAGAASVGRYLYVVGGNDGETSTNTVERYDPHLNKWTEVAPMQKKRAGGGVASLNGYIYAVGGFEDVSPLSSGERYNPESNSWAPIADMSCKRGGLGLAVLGGYLYALGGHNGREYLTLAEIYDSYTDKWTSLSSMKIARAGVGIAVSQMHPQEESYRSLINLSPPM